MACIFCDIIKGKKSGHLLYRNNYAIVLLDIFPSIEGHSMVIPLRHKETILELSKKELAEVFAVCQKIIKALEKTYHTRTFSIGINHGEPAGVPHLHIHILPRFKNDQGGIIQSLVKKETTASLTQVVEKIKKNIT